MLKVFEECWQTGNEREGPDRNPGQRSWKRKAQGVRYVEDRNIAHSSPGKSAELPSISPKMHPADQVSEAMDGRVGSLVVCYAMTVILGVLVNN